MPVASRTKDDAKPVSAIQGLASQLICTGCSELTFCAFAVLLFDFSVLLFSFFYALQGIFHACMKN